MAVRYNKLFKKLIDMEITPAQLMKDAGCSSNILTHLKKNDYISLQSLEKICEALDCSVDEIMEFRKTEES
jgi:DNA-binding Xre family transcriptional regulator